MSRSKCPSSFLAVALLALMGCGGASVRVDIRHDIDTSASKVVVLPMLLCDGQKLKPGNASYSNAMADERLAHEWSVDIGSGNTVNVSKNVMDSLPGAYPAVDALLARRDIRSMAGPDSGLADFLHVIATRFVDGALAVALVFEDEHEYLASGEVHVNLGLFDNKKQAWKWLTVHKYSSGMFSSTKSRAPYQATVASLVGESFAELKKQNGGAVR
jgi:hypothetical protein